MYPPSSSRVLASVPSQFKFFGSLLQIAYWETFDGSAIRDLEGSKSGSVEGMDVSPDAQCFVSGGADKLIKVRANTCDQICSSIAQVVAHEIHRAELRT